MTSRLFLFVTLLGLILALYSKYSLANDEFESRCNELLIAAGKGDIPQVKLLIQNKNYVNNCVSKEHDTEGGSPLMMAVNAECLECIDVLLEAGANVNHDAVGDYNALMIASGLGNVAIVEKLLKAGADPNLQSEDGMSALMIAAYRNHASVIYALLNGGADKTLEGQDKVTALDYAYIKGVPSVVIALKGPSREYTAEEVEELMRQQESQYAQ